MTDAPQAPQLSEEFKNDFRQAVAACRADNWRQGYLILTRLAGEAGPKKTLPGVFYSYLGVAVARCEGQKHQGMELVRYGLKLQPFKADNYANLAQMNVILGRRQEALKALERGMALSPFSPRLKELRRSLGVRRPPPIRFLARDNPINVILGQITWRLHQRQREKEEDDLGLT